MAIRQPKIARRMFLKQAGRFTAACSLSGVFLHGLSLKNRTVAAEAPPSLRKDWLARWQKAITGGMRNRYCDRRWAKTPGVVWMDLAPYDATLQAIFEANHDPGGWGGLSATPRYLGELFPA